MRTSTRLFIIPLFILCSCKSSSFLNQRYTSYRQVHHKIKPAAVLVNKAQEPEYRAIRRGLAAGVPEQQLLYSAAVELPSGKVKEAKRVEAAVKRIAPVKQLGQKVASNIRLITDKQSPDQAVVKKTFKENMYHAMGLFDTLFKIVLFSIILAILVAIIMILLLI